MLWLWTYVTILSLGMDTYSIVWMEDVGSRRVVHNDNFLQISAQFVKILHVISSVEHTWFSE
jgi:hypothetical protein